MSRPWSREELEALLPKIEAALDRIEAEASLEARPLPPMTAEECTGWFLRLMDAAATRALTARECFLHGQLLANYRMAVRAETLGRQGRFFVLSEDELRGLAEDVFKAKGGKTSGPAD